MERSYLPTIRFQVGADDCDSDRKTLIPPVTPTSEHHQPIVSIASQTEEDSRTLSKFSHSDSNVNTRCKHNRDCDESIQLSSISVNGTDGLLQEIGALHSRFTDSTYCPSKKKSKDTSLSHPNNTQHNGLVGSGIPFAESKANNDTSIDSLGSKEFVTQIPEDEEDESDTKRRHR